MSVPFSSPSELSVKFICPRFFNNPKFFGTGPVKLLKGKSIISRFEALIIIIGIEPEDWFFLR